LCEHSEIVSRSVSLMMANPLEISFLKHDDKNYFIYPFLCYNWIFCIFYRFYRINVWNVVLLFGSPCNRFPLLQLSLVYVNKPKARFISILLAKSTCYLWRWSCGYSSEHNC
jgi:hypothetical protein